MKRQLCLRRFNVSRRGGHARQLALGLLLVACSGSPLGQPTTGSAGATGGGAATTGGARTSTSAPWNTGGTLAAGGGVTGGQLGTGGTHASGGSNAAGGQSATGGTRGTGYIDPGVDTSDCSNPAWFYDLVIKARSQGYTEITRFLYHGACVFYLSPRCCDIPSELCDRCGQLLCHPDGGWGGDGDGRCPDFFSAATYETRIWIGS
jgi:hypothetical protein